MARTRWYVTVVMATWIFEPELRRYIDWRSTFHSLSLLSILPLVTLLPGLLVMKKDWGSLGEAYRRVVIVWLFSFGYAFIIAAIQLQFAAAIYSLIEFCLPIAFGPLMTTSTTRDWYLLYGRFSRAVVVCVAVSSAYGLLQYVDPPPWDVYWAQQSSLEGSQGKTVAFGFRIFGTLNSTGPFANACMLALMLCLPILRLRSWYIIAAALPIVVALALTSVRSAWLGLAVGLLIHMLLSAHRSRATAGIMIVALLTGSLSLTAASRSKDFGASLTSLVDRASTLSSLGYDQSVQDRQGETHDAFSEALQEPLGAGLGVIGVAAKLGATGDTANLDSGYLSRLVEMGFAGFILFVLALAIALASSLKAYAAARRNGDSAAVDILAAGISVQIVLIMFEFGADSHASLLGMFFWAAVCLASRHQYVRERSLQSGTVSDHTRLVSVGSASL